MFWRGLKDVAGSCRDKEGAIVARAEPLCSAREIEHEPDKEGAQPGPRIDSGLDWRVDGGRWTLDKVVRAGVKMNGVEGFETLNGLAFGMTNGGKSSEVFNGEETKVSSEMDDDLSKRTPINIKRPVGI